MRKICVITGSRAEYGILSNLMHLINDESTLQLQIVATNMHLAPNFGDTYKEIEKDGFTINKKVHMLLSSDEENATVKSIGLGIIGFADALEDLKPDLILILGDRYEMLAAATAALIYKIPIAHLHGGEITEGAYDDSIRHAITKMSHLHFTSTEEYRRRVIQLGESPESVFNVGALGVENILHTKCLTKEALEIELNLSLDDRTILVTYHPVTLSQDSSYNEIEALLTVLSEEYVDYRIIFTLPNSDTNNSDITKRIVEFVHQNENAVVFNSLGRQKLFSLLNHIDAVIGNSSSGIIEVPGFGIPSLNIGDRQKGRMMPPSVVCCEGTYQDIKRGMQKVLSVEMRQIAQKKENPYMKKDTAQKILNVIKTTSLEGFVQKKFYDL